VRKGKRGIAGISAALSGKKISVIFWIISDEYFGIILQLSQEA
jgi:hypothetical protein